jgi:hypothetical protein
LQYLPVIDGARVLFSLLLLRAGLDSKFCNGASPVFTPTGYASYPPFFSGVVYITSPYRRDGFTLKLCAFSRRLADKVSYVKGRRKNRQPGECLPVISVSLGQT